MNDIRYSRFMYVARDYIESFFKFQVWKNDVGGGLAMDIGCGPGERTTQFILPLLLPNIEKLIAIDVSPEMIDVAKLRYPHPKVDYHVLDIEDRISLERWRGKIQQIVSTFCFYWLKNPEQGFRNVYDLLQPGGQAAIISALWCPVWDATVDLAKDPKWDMYLKGTEVFVPEAHEKGHTAGHFKNILEKIGFSVALCSEETIMTEFHSEDDGKVFYNTVSGVSGHVLSADREAFENDIFDRTVKIAGRSANGKPLYRTIALRIFVTKPK